MRYGPRRPWALVLSSHPKAHASQVDNHAFGLGVRQRWAIAGIDAKAVLSRSPSQDLLWFIDVLIEQDRIAVRILDYETRGAGTLLVSLYVRLDTAGGELCL